MTVIQTEAPLGLSISKFQQSGASNRGEIAGFNRGIGSKITALIPLQTCLVLQIPIPLQPYSALQIPFPLQPHLALQIPFPLQPHLALQIPTLLQPDLALQIPIPL